jgi:hypothetical protein
MRNRTVLDLRTWIRKAAEQQKQEAAEVAATTEPAAKPDDHYAMLILCELRDAVEAAFKAQAEGTVDWWEVANVIAGLSDDLLEELEQEFDSEGV